LLVILLGGGAKKRQQQDIAGALARWQDYKRRKQENPHAANS
jgi:putative component of toxin-antitoxin plasmid stabilization module